MDEETKLILMERGFIDDLETDKALREFLKALLRFKMSKIKDLFTNEIHYKIAESLSEIPDVIYIAPHYVALEYFRAKEAYVVGINSDKKLFINAVPYDVDTTIGRVGRGKLLEWAYLLTFTVLGKKRVDFYKTDDREIYKCFGYDYDCRIDGIKEIGKGGRYRVQGDVVLSVDELLDLDVKEALRSTISNAIRGWVHMFMLNVIGDRIVRILSSHGISAEVNNEYIQIWGVDDELYSKKKTLSKALAKLIADELYISDIMQTEFKVKIRATPYKRMPYQICITDAKGLRGIEITVFIRDAPVNFGNAVYRSVGLRIDIILGSLVDYWADRIAESVLDDLEVGWNEIYFNRHTIKYYGYPSSFSIEYEFPWIGLPESRCIIPVVFQEYFAVDKEIILEHPEHGEARYKVAKPISFMVERVSNEDGFREKMNSYALKRLISVRTAVSK